MPGNPPPLLPRSTPSSEGISAKAVTAMLDRLDERSVECHSVMVVRRGHVVAEGWWTPYSPDRPQLLYSLTKSFTSIAVGLAISDGLLRLDDRVVDVLPERVPDDASAASRRLTVDHLLTMTTGHRTDTLARAWELEPTDLVKGFLRLPPDDPPGTRHAYNNPPGFVLARMVERVTGRGVPDLLDDRLFGPMGIEGAEWDRVGSGTTFGFHGLHLTTEAVAAFGELLLRRGQWRGRQLVPADWVDLATRRHVDTVQLDDGSRTPDWLQGYGYHFWMSRHGYRGDGAMGQYCLVLPAYDLVVVLTAATTDMQAPLDAVWECLLPGVDAVDGAGDSTDSTEDAGLADRLRNLALPLPAGDPPAPGPTVTATVDGHDETSALPHGTTVHVDPVAGGWRIRLHTGESTLDFDAGYAAWRESSPLGRPVLAAAAQQDGAFVADLCVVSTPSRVRLEVGAGRATATWNIAPLVGPDLVRQLRSPLMTRPDVA